MQFKRYEYRKNVYFFCHSVQKVKYYIDSVHRVKYFKHLLVIIMMIRLKIMKKNLHFRKLKYYIQSIKFKRGYYEHKHHASGVCSFLCTLHLVLGWTSFWRNYSMNTAWHECDQPVELLRWNEVCTIAAFRSSALLSLMSLTFLLTIAQRFSRSGKFAGQSSTVTPGSLNQLLETLTVSLFEQTDNKKNYWTFNFWAALVFINPAVRVFMYLNCLSAKYFMDQHFDEIQSNY